MQKTEAPFGILTDTVTSLLLDYRRLTYDDQAPLVATLIPPREVAVRLLIGHCILSEANAWRLVRFPASDPTSRRIRGVLRENEISRNYDLYDTNTSGKKSYSDFDWYTLENSKKPWLAAFDKWAVQQRQQAEENCLTATVIDLDKIGRAHV